MDATAVTTDGGSIDHERQALIRRIALAVGTPTYIYDAAALRQRLALVRQHFDVVRFAQKALPNIHVLRLLRLGHALVDCVSEGELQRALAAGFCTGLDPAEIVYTADLLTEATIERLVALQVPLNAGSEDMLTQIGRRSRGHRVWLRINPGFGSGHSKKVNTGGESSKHGIWHANIADARARIDEFDRSGGAPHAHRLGGRYASPRARVRRHGRPGGAAWS
jgi:diaminopimelate decarboxylase